MEPYVAQQVGLFAKAGVNADLTIMELYTEMIQAVVVGQLDVGLADSIQLVTAVLHGLPLGFFAGGPLYSSAAPTTLLCTTKNSTLQRAANLEGQAVAVSTLNSTSTLATRAWIRANGADETKIKIFELPVSQMPAALERGTIAAAVLSEPFYTFVHDRLRIFTQPMDMVAKSYLSSAWFCSREWAARNADSLRRVRSVLYDTARWSNTHRADTLPMLAKIAKMDLASLRGMNRVTFATTLDAALLQPVVDLALKFKVLDHTVPMADLVIPIS